MSIYLICPLSWIPTPDLNKDNHAVYFQFLEQNFRNFRKKDITARFSEIFEIWFCYRNFRNFWLKSSISKIQQFSTLPEILTRNSAYQLHLSRKLPNFYGMEAPIDWRPACTYWKIIGVNKHQPIDVCHTKLFKVQTSQFMPVYYQLD